MRKCLKEYFFPPAMYKFLTHLKSSIRSFIKYSATDFKKNEEIRNIHGSQRCFILGTGPSLKDQDLTLLENEIVIGVSGLFNHKDIAVIKPNYYVLAPVFEYHLKYNKEETYINWLKAMDDALPNDVVMIIHIGDKKYIEKSKIFKKKKIYWVKYAPWDGETISKLNLSKIPNIKSVSETAIYVALYLGFEKIYLLGFDHNWFDDLHVYFDTEKYNKHFETTGDAAAKKFGFDSEFQMLRHAQMFKKYKKLYALKKNIYNANANTDSYVDTFPKVSYESLFEEEVISVEESR